MAVQTTYNFDPKIAFAGMLANQAVSFIRSFRNVNSANAPFGTMWKKDATDDQAANFPGSPTDQLIGIGVNQFARNNIGLSSSDATGIMGSAASGGSAMFDLLAEGPIYVVPEEAVDPSKPVYVRFASGTGTVLGSFRASSDSASAMLLVGARWLSTGSATVPAVLWYSATEQAASASDSSVTYAQASLSATTGPTTVFKTRTDRHFVVDEVVYVNPTGVVQSDSNNYVLALKQGATVIAQYSTAITGGQGTIAANTPTDLVLSATAANLVVPPGTALTLTETLTGTLTLAAGTFVIHGHYV